MTTDSEMSEKVKRKKRAAARAGAGPRSAEQARPAKGGASRPRKKKAAAVPTRRSEDSAASAAIERPGRDSCLASQEGEPGSSASWTVDSDEDNDERVSTARRR